MKPIKYTIHNSNENLEWSHHGPFETLEEAQEYMLMDWNLAPPVQEDEYVYLAWIRTGEEATGRELAGVSRSKKGAEAIIKAKGPWSFTGNGGHVETRRLQS
jgi:hypothetical protein